MVDKKPFVVLICTMILCGCWGPLNFMQDAYYLEEGGLRSRKQYKKYADLDDPLPSFIMSHRAYKPVYIKNITTGEEINYSDSNSFLVFLDSSRAIGYPLKGKAVSETVFKVSKGHIAYYEVKDDQLLLYRYDSANFGDFETWKVLEGKGDTIVLRKADSSYSYYCVIAENVPAKWLRDIEVPW